MWVSVKLKTPFKYLLLFEIHDNDIDALIKDFDDFQNVYVDVYDFTNHSFYIEDVVIGESFNIQDKISMNLMREIPAISYIYLNRIYEISSKKLKDQILDNLRLLTKDNNSLNIIDRGCRDLGLSEVPKRSF